MNIGDFFHSGKNLKILTQNHDYDHGRTIPYDSQKIIAKTTTIGNFVWIGDDVLLLPGVTIGEGAIIQAGSVVSMNIPPMGIAGGNPAKVFKQRDVAHFESLKKEKAFF